MFVRRLWEPDDRGDGRAGGGGEWSGASPLATEGSQGVGTAAPTGIMGAATPGSKEGEGMTDRTMEPAGGRKAKFAALPPSLPPLGVSRETAAAYIGVSPAKFDQMVSDGRMPAPKRIDGRKVWDRRQLEAAFVALPDDEAPNPWDAVA